MFIQAELIYTSIDVKNNSEILNTVKYASKVTEREVRELKERGTIS